MVACVSFSVNSTCAPASEHSSFTSEESSSAVLDTLSHETPRRLKLCPGSLASATVLVIVCHVTRAVTQHPYPTACFHESLYVCCSSALSSPIVRLETMSAVRAGRLRAVPGSAGSSGSRGNNASPSVASISAELMPCTPRSSDDRTCFSGEACVPAAVVVATKTCGLCLRTDAHPNRTPTKVKSKTLQFVPGRLLRCISCRQWIRLHLKGKTPSEVQEECKQNPEMQAQLTACVEQFEDLWESTLGYLKNSADKLDIPSWCTVQEEEGTEDRLNLGVFWPRHVWERELPGEPFPDASGTSYASGGVKHFGLWRDKRHGEPPGSITAVKLSSIKAVKTKEVSNSRTSLKGDAHRSFGLAAKAITGFDVTKETLEDGSSSIGFKDAGAAAVHKKRKLQPELSNESSDDWGDLAPSKRMKLSETAPETPEPTPKKNEAKVSHAPRPRVSLNRVGHVRKTQKTQPQRRLSHRQSQRRRRRARCIHLSKIVLSPSPWKFWRKREEFWKRWHRRRGFCR